MRVRSRRDRESESPREVQDLIAWLSDVRRLRLVELELPLE